MRPLPTTALALVLVALTASCRTTTEARPFAVRDRAVAVHLTVERLLEAHAGGEIVGYAVLFRSQGGDDSVFWSVRDPWHHELGLVDGLGRAWRFRPHGEEPDHVGTGSVSEWVRLLLRAPGPVTLLEGEADPALAWSPDESSEIRAYSHEWPAPAQ